MPDHPYRYILFDLDETLYPREAGVMPALIARMNRFMVQRVGIPPDDVSEKRRYFYQHYGTTLRGLVEEHHIDPEEFLAFVHDVDLHQFIAPSPPLAKMLARLPLDKVIFTNADTAHAERVLNVLAVRPYFSQIIDIRAIDYRSKPDPYAYRQALALLDAAGEECIMVEDNPRNLIPAKSLGMTTVLVDGQSSPALGVDYFAPTIFHLEPIIQTLVPAEGVK
ncbi:MAG: pyrimidine 5'-nucleotidase [Chloroflexi bacterium]|nr:MAG: pyrimidine 5'-nucleotidase [Chloroflexota bacterium]